MPGPTLAVGEDSDPGMLAVVGTTAFDDGAGVALEAGLMDEPTTGFGSAVVPAAAAGAAGGVPLVRVTSPGKSSGGRLSSGSLSLDGAEFAGGTADAAWADRWVGSGVEIVVLATFSLR